MTTAISPRTAVEAAVAALDAVMPDGTVMAVVVRLPQDHAYHVASPARQCPAATYGMLHGVAQRQNGLLPPLS